MTHSPAQSSGDSGQNLVQSWDAVETYFECITTCSLDGEGVECLTRCVEVHLKKEV